MEENKNMLDIIFVLLFFFAVILMLYGLSERNVAFVFLAASLWLILGLLILQGIEIPVYTNYDTATGNFTSGTQNIQTNLEPLAYLLMGLGAIMFIVSVTFMMEYLSDYKRMRR